MIYAVIVAASLLALPAPQQQPPAAAVADPAQEFQKSLMQVQESVQRGSFERADQQLKALLEAHPGADYARRRQVEIVELAKRCAFQSGRDAPKFADLISGELVRYDARGGDLEIRYASGKLKDFVRVPMGRESLLVHPAVFVETFTVEAACPAGMTPGREGPSLRVGLGTDEEFLVCFGTAPNASSVSDTYIPPQIIRMKGSAQQVVEKLEKPATPYDKKSELKVVVGAGSVTVYRDGKRIMQTKRSARESGQIALESLTDFDRLTLKGKIQSSWPQGLLDAATQTALEKFEKSWLPRKTLPAWLFEAIAPASAPPADALGDRIRAAAAGESIGSFKARRDEIEALAGKRSLAELEGEWKKLADEFPREPVARIELALVQLKLGRPDAAQATCDAALSAGIAPKELGPLPRMLVQSRTGPVWSRLFSYESAHYVVKSDIDKEICIEATKRLEESYRSYGFRLAPVPGLEKKKFAVFLFAGQAGYLDYARDTLLSAPASTAGLYSSLLKQLLIWNLPDRSQMFETVRHEGFHQYLDRLADAPPIWFNEGMAEYFELADLYGGEWKEGQAHAGHVRMLNDSPAEWVPLATLFAMEPKAFQGPKIHQHYAQSWAVIHYLRQGPKDAQETFRRLWTAISTNQSREQATAAAFGALDLQALEEAVKRHVRKLAG